MVVGVEAIFTLATPEILANPERPAAVLVELLQPVVALLVARWEQETGATMVVPAAMVVRSFKRGTSETLALLPFILRLASVCRVAVAAAQEPMILEHKQEAAEMALLVLLLLVGREG